MIMSERGGRPTTPSRFTLEPARPTREDRSGTSRRSKQVFGTPAPRAISFAPLSPEMSNEPGDKTFTAGSAPKPRAGDGERHPALVFLRGELLAAPIPLEREEVTLGRALEADVRVNDARASRMHARIRVERDLSTSERRYRLTDLGSTNGTLLN